MSTTIQIILCKTCEGSGNTSHRDIVDYHKRDYDTYTTRCHQCGGSGRLKVTTVVTTEPFAPLPPDRR